jgi:hypothetical protein
MPPLPWEAMEGEDDDGNGEAEEEDFGFANIEEVAPCLHLRTLHVHLWGPLAVGWHPYLASRSPMRSARSGACRSIERSNATRVRAREHQDLANYGGDEMIAEAIRNGDLRRYAKDIEGDLRRVERVILVAVPVLVGSRLHPCVAAWGKSPWWCADSPGKQNTTQESIADYVHESENLAHLHMKIRSCDKLLAGMEDVLAGFQADLGKVSEEIKGLQHRAGDLRCVCLETSFVKELCTT